jgi:hypothetical protein
VGATPCALWQPGESSHRAEPQKVQSTEIQTTAAESKPPQQPEKEMSDEITGTQSRNRPMSKKADRAEQRKREAQEKAPRHYTTEELERRASWLKTGGTMTPDDIEVASLSMLVVSTRTVLDDYVGWYANLQRQFDLIGDHLKGYRKMRDTGEPAESDAACVKRLITELNQLKRTDREDNAKHP